MSCLVRLLLTIYPLPLNHRNLLKRLNTVSWPSARKPQTALPLLASVRQTKHSVTTQSHISCIIKNCEVQDCAVLIGYGSGYLLINRATRRAEIVMHFGILLLRHACFCFLEWKRRGCSISLGKRLLWVRSNELLSCMTSHRRECDKHMYN